MIKLNLNDVQKEQIKQLKISLPRTHYVDIILRHNGQDIKFQADWLKELIKHIDVNREAIL